MVRAIHTFSARPFTFGQTTPVAFRIVFADGHTEQAEGLNPEHAARRAQWYYDRAPVTGYQRI